MTLPSQHLATGDLEARERRAHEVRDQAQVLGDEIQIGVYQDAEDGLALRNLRGLV